MSPSFSQPDSRQELYDRIRQSSRSEVIREEMIRHGFWPADKDLPQVQREALERKKVVANEMNVLRTELNRLQNAEAMRKAIRKRRMEESKRKQADTKERREKERRERAARWEDQKKRDIGYLGQEISPASLRETKTDTARLEQYGLTEYDSVETLAEKMNITVNELRFLAFSRRVSKTTHYQRFRIAKKSGGQRLISAPMPRLKEAQHCVLENILAVIPVHDAAHGFRQGRSIVGNAAPHTGKDVVINIDLKDFFPTITYPRVKGMFRSLGFSEQIAVIFALLCTEPEVDEVKIDGDTYYVTKSERHLPQGAPTSPAITNILCRRLDRRLMKLAETLGFVYTRYADDISFSAKDTSPKNIGKLLRKTGSIVEHEGFTVHPDKTRILHKGRKQEVTGIVVNRGLSVDRKTLRRLRATLFQLEKDGVNGKRWGHGDDVVASVEGYAHFVAMVDKEKGAALLERIATVKAQIDYKKKQYKRYPKKTPSWKLPKVEAQPPDTSSADAALRRDTAQTETPPHQRDRQAEPSDTKTDKKGPWWKFW